MPCERSPSLIPEAGQHLDRLEMVCALVPRHLVVDTVGLAGGQRLVQVLAGEGGVGHDGLGGRRHLRVRRGVGSGSWFCVSLRFGRRHRGRGALPSCCAHSSLLILLLPLELGYALHQPLVLNLVFQEGVEEGRVLGRDRGAPIMKKPRQLMVVRRRKRALRRC